MAKLTRTQAKYIQEKFEQAVFAQAKSQERAYEKEYQVKSNQLTLDYKKKYKEWDKVSNVIQAMVSHVLFKEYGASSSWNYAYNNMISFNKETKKLSQELHESLLFCDGTLETAQQIINNFTSKLKEIK